jgi:PglZ domain.
MFNHWLISDIEEAARKSDRIVISDAKQFLTFVVKELKDYAIITLNSPEEEMNARLQAMTAHHNSKVIFLCFFPKKDIHQLIEFSGVGGYIDLDNPDRYIRTKLYKEGLGNVTLTEPKLLLAAKLSIGKDFTWWKGIVNETIEPLNLNEHLALLISDPKQYEIYHDEDVYSVLRDDLFRIMGKPTTPVDAPTLLRELANTILDGLANNSINSDLLDIYDMWSKDTELIPVLRSMIDKWSMPPAATPITAHNDHPFAEIDRRLLIIIGEKLRNNATTVDLTETIRHRISSRRASEFKAKWLSDLLTLLEFDTTELFRYDTLAKITEYYRTKFSMLDAAMRHLYVAWLAEPQLLRPLQELYESHLKSLLGIWFAVVDDKYKPSQFGLIVRALGSHKKVAILICDGLRLEIAETIVSRVPKDVVIKRDVRNAKLPSVTENGMSALFGIDEAVNSTSARFDNLRQVIPGVEIINYVDLGNGISADRLVIMFGDIDQVGEHKGLAGLRDIDNYENELAYAIGRLHRLGYNDVFITADHGFVITGLLDEASKVPAPNGVDVKERFFLTDEIISQSNFIRREDNFPGSRYQYYAKTDRPFRTRGAYGYAHGGFTPQECLIPLYCFSTSSTSDSVEAIIANKDSLSSVTGQFFTVKLKGNEAAIGSRLKVCLYSNGSLAATAIVKIDESENGSAEFESIDGILSVIVQDPVSGIQLDNAPVKKSTSRDLDDLF